METTTEKQTDLMGQLVTVTKIYHRDKSKGVRRWVEAEQPPMYGWIVGFRTIWDGHVDWDTGEYGQKESGNYFVPTVHKECALVVFSPRQKPFNVPLDGFELAPRPAGYPGKGETMSDTKHTPGPWKVYGTPGKWPGIDSDTTSIVIYGEDGNFERGIRGESNEEAFANARFIVRAVNSHYALLAVSERARDMIGLMYSVGVGNEDEAKIMSDLITALNAAIAAAKGTTP